MATDARIEFAEFEKIAPEVRAALTALSKAVGDSGFDKALIELIKIRASQINGCTFCVQFHLNLARKFGVPQTKLDLVAVWRDAGIFNAREMAALAWTETLTHVTPSGVADEDFAAARNEFDKSELVFLTAAIASINAWNRIAMAFRFLPPIPQETVSA
jgi:AhpD family alkylhydroperoxidase